MANEGHAEPWNGEEAGHWVTHRLRYDTMLASFGDRLLAAAQVAASDRVLDVGCPTGHVALVPAGQITGPVLDIRQDAEYGAGHIPGASHIELGSLAAPTAPASAPARSRGSLLELGAASVTDVSGGFEAWRAAGLPIQPAQERPTLADRRTARADARQHSR